MKRRAFLATTGLVATTGCLGRAVSDGDEPTRADTTTGGDDGTGSDTTTGDESDAFGDHGRGCPTVHEDAEATVCAGETGDRRVSFGQSADRLSAGEVLELTLVNRDAESVGLNPYDWAVYRETESGWQAVDPGPTIEPWVVLESGERLHWRVGVGGATADTDGDRVYGGSKRLDPGAYAFAATAEVDDRAVSLVAPFTVE